MKTYRSAFLLSLLFLFASCGQEQFGTPAQNQTKSENPIQALEQRSCANLTLINPEVDILYVVDNSSSQWFVPNDVKTAIQNTINTISNEFDYRVIGTPLLKTSSGNSDFQVLAKNPSTLPATFNTKKVSASSEFTFFSNTVQGSQEPGLRRIFEFMTAHSTDGLFRQNAYTFIILFSNGRDTEVELSYPYGGTYQASNGTNGTIYADRLQSLKQVRSALNARQFRLFSVTPSSVGGSSCQSGYFTSDLSYVKMSKDLYELPPISPNPAPEDQGAKPYPDHYNLCSESVSGIFTSVNSAIKQIVIPHKYQYWPVTFSASTGIDTSTVKVFKSSPTTTPAEMSDSQWDIILNPKTLNGTSVNTRIEPTPGEPTDTKWVIKFTPGNEIVYPSCVTVTSQSNLEYFKSVVITQAATTNDPLNPIVVKVNGVQIPNSAFSYRGLVYNENIKVSYNGYLDTPEQFRTGYFITITDPQYYYKSGDNVTVGFKPAPLN
jgi:hypothetical protein